MKRILLMLSILLALPTTLLPEKATKEGITVEMQDLTPVPLGNLFKPQDGDRQDMASIDVNKKLNLCLIGISIKNESELSYTLDPNLLNPYAHRRYALLLDKLEQQDNKLNSFTRNAASLAFAAIPFGVSAGIFILIAMDRYMNYNHYGYMHDVMLRATIAGILTSATIALTASGSYYLGRALTHRKKLINDREQWIKIYGLGQEPLEIKPGQTVKKVILCDRAIYKTGEFILSLAQTNDPKGKIVSFSMPLVQ